VEAARLGADAIGLVFYAPSPRGVTADVAEAILAGLPPFVTAVGLFVDADVAYVRDSLSRLPLDLLQFHGDEDPAYCRSFGKAYIKAIRMRPETDLAAEAVRYREARALLLDAYHPDARGGTGVAFEWSRVDAPPGVPLVLAGGLHAGNVRAGIAAMQPWAVDVSSGVEAAKGIKDAAKMAAFLNEVYEVDHAERHRSRAL
jgi:phosphoribosylanthranilate isomerase